MDYFCKLILTQKSLRLLTSQQNITNSIFSQYSNNNNMMRLEKQVMKSIQKATELDALCFKESDITFGRYKLLV